jgi:peptidoglycan/LPS O-acetylase OafA/YrhL
VTVGAGITAHVVPAVGTRSLLWLPANIDWFALGMLLAVISACGALPNDRARGTRRWQPRSFGVARTVAAATGSCWTLGVLTFWFATLPLAGPRVLLVPNTWEWVLKHLLYGASALFLLAPLTLTTPWRWAAPLEWRPTRLVGEISYGVYLWHLPLLLAIQHWLGYRTFSGHFWTLLGVTSVASVVVAWLSWHLLEQPLIRFANRRYSEPGAGSSPNGTAGMRNAASTSS